MRARAAVGLALILSMGSARASAEEFTQARLTNVMNSVFGAGKWRLTGGYRTPEREDELRSQGAMTVRPGGMSAHSLGRPGASGAYDVVVNGMDPWEAAARLRAAGAPFSRYMPKGVHGSQGPHLHLEPNARGLARPGGSGPLGSPWLVAERTPAQQAMADLQSEATAGDPDAQLQLSRAYAVGLAARPDQVAAYIWAARAAENVAGEPDLRANAVETKLDLVRRMRPEDIAYARRFADPAGQGREGGPLRLQPGGVAMVLASTAAR